MEEIKSVAVGRFSVTIYRDPQHPRKEFDHLGTMLYTSKRYSLGDRFAGQTEVIEEMENPDNIALLVYAYIHSGVTIRTTPFQCPWDSGMIGCIFVHREDVLREWKRSRMSKKLRAQVINILEAEVREMDEYLQGAVYGFVIRQGGDDVDSCWGYYGLDHCLTDAVASAQNMV